MSSFRENMPYHCGSSRECWAREWDGVSPNGVGIFTVHIVSGYMLHRYGHWSYHKYKPKAERGPSLSARIAECHKCDQYSPCTDKCRLYGCSCKMQEYSQREWASCPLGKWPIVKVNNEPILSKTGV